MDIIELRKKLDNIVYGQHYAKDKLLAAFCANMELYDARRKWNNTNILLFGPTGVGKTFLVENLCSLLNIPIYIIDASRLTQTGFAGQKIDHALEQLLQKNNGNINVAQRAVLFIDEFDKLHMTNDAHYHTDIAGIGVQYELLKLMEGATYTIQYNGQQIEFNTENFIIVCAGSFSYVNEIAPDMCGSWLQKAGFINELIGRFTYFIQLSEFNSKDYYELLNLGNLEVIKKYEFLLGKYNYKIELNKEEYENIVKKAMSSNFGIRTINMLLENILSDFYYKCIMSLGRELA